MLISIEIVSGEIIVEFENVIWYELLTPVHVASFHISSEMWCEKAAFIIRHSCFIYLSTKISMWIMQNILK